MNCAAHDPAALDSLLFGHVSRGERPAGIFNDVGEGTVFLDEIGVLSEASQSRILRAIERHEVVPIGTERPAKITARIVAATQKRFGRRGQAGPLP